MKTRKELLKEEIKQYRSLIRTAKKRREETSSYSEIRLMKSWIKEYNRQIRLDQKEIKEIEAKENSWQEENEVIKFYNTFLIKVAGTVKYIEREIKSIKKAGGKYDLETAINVATIELEDLRTFVSEVRF